MLLDAIATVILAGMMLIPVVNVFVGVIVGASVGGLPGAMAGFLLAALVIAAEKLIGDRRGWFELNCAMEGAMSIQHPPVEQEMHREVSSKRLQLKRRPRVAPKKRRRGPRRSIPESRVLH